MSYFEPEHPTLLADPVTAADHARGPVACDVTLIEYGDFACPHCRRAHALVEGLLTQFPEVRFVFRANPRSHLFPMAALAAEGAEAAAAQGRYWEMHQLLFENQELLSRETLVGLARRLGLDVPRFDAEVQAGAHSRAVHAQELSGWHSHVLATPTFFVNGVRFDDSLDDLPEAVARARRRADRARHVFRNLKVETTERTRRVSIAVGPHALVGDLMPADAGDDAGPSPYDLLLAALGSCTAMTVKWAAERDRLPLRRVEVQLSQSRTPSGHVFRRSIALEGDLTDEQRAQLELAAEGSPISRTLRGEIRIETRTTIDRTVDEAGEESFPASDPPAWTTGREPAR